MSYYTPYRTERGWRFQCCMNAESEPFKTEHECMTAAAKELAIDTKRSKRVGVMGDIYREALRGINARALAQPGAQDSPNTTNDL